MRPISGPAARAQIRPEALAEIKRALTWTPADSAAPIGRDRMTMPAPGGLL